MILLAVPGANWRSRILISSGAFTWCSTLLLVLSLVDSREWLETNVILILLVVLALSGIVGAIMLFTLASAPVLGMELFILIGNALGGILATLLSFILKVEKI